ncbi:hypothetical protein DSO57_1026203 [Entomophthora muscae]|uniref:Uncharacterized protein n=1 Tax=Entomophthora muscae TaxID=34485 RepID=A0ACC2SEV4_9FUNG|nr:hypothetical protein DSO57_1026203 [Entomophthora muscae]
MLSSNIAATCSPAGYLLTIHGSSLLKDYVCNGVKGQSCADPRHSLITWYLMLLEDHCCTNFHTSLIPLGCCIYSELLRDLNLDILWADSLQAQLPDCLLFSGLKPESNLSSVKLLMPISLEPPAPMPPLQKNPASPTNGSTGLVNDPKITGATAAGELKKLPVE